MSRNRLLIREKCNQYIDPLIFGWTVPLKILLLVQKICLVTGTCLKIFQLVWKSFYFFEDFSFLKILPPKLRSLYGTFLFEDFAAFWKVLLKDLMFCCSFASQGHLFEDLATCLHVLDSSFAQCVSCGKPRKFLLQLYCPDEEVTSGFHRTVYIFICTNNDCWTNR